MREAKGLEEVEISRSASVKEKSAIVSYLKSCNSELLFAIEDAETAPASDVDILRH